MKKKQQKETRTLRFLYHTIPGRLVLRQMVRPRFSRRVGGFLSKKLSRRMIGPFRRKHRISLDGIIVPEGGFASFNDFFSRVRENVSFDGNPLAFCSPCDAYLTSYTLGDDSLFSIKHAVYSTAELLEDGELAARFRGGKALIFRLTPAHYHRYHFVDDAVVVTEKDIPGVLHTVRPIAAESRQVYVRNARCYAYMDTAHFGPMVQMEVGALMVGKIVNHPVEGAVHRGDEKGYFQFGGSTIVILLQKGVVPEGTFAACEDNGHEIPVTLGERLFIREA